MKGFAPANALRRYRPLLLAMEAVGWFHMAGKAHPDFLRKHGGQKTDYNYEDWYKNENPQFPWDDLLCWVKNRFDKIDSTQFEWPSTLTKFITEHAKRGGTGLLGLLQAAHGIVSGIEKNLPKNASGYLQQDATHMWISSAFGYPQRNLLADPPGVLSERGWQSLVKEIERIMEGLKELGQSGCDSSAHWWNWRESAIGPESFLRKAFSSTLAETRLPNNDVTLWDQSYVAAALFKSAVAGAILEAGKFPWKDSKANKIKQETRWRLLTVGVGADHYEARSVRIGDWLGAQQTIREFFECVRRLVEVKVPVGSLLYRDSCTMVFSFPGERAGSQNRTFYLDKDCWLSWLRHRIDKLAKSRQLETPPYCHLSDSTRSLVPMVKEMGKARETLAVPLDRPWKISSEASDSHVCPVCLVRPNGNRNNKQAPCKVCAERRGGRLDAWLRGCESSNTIWLEEVADTNGRIALLTLSLNLEPWLEGDAVDSLRTQSIADWRRFNPSLENIANPIDPSDPFESLVAYVKTKLPNFDKKDPVLRSVQEGYRYETNWRTFFEKIVEDRSNAPSWDDLNDDQRARWLVHQLCCKLPSPGRVYRFWRQAEDFFADLLRMFRKISARDANRWRVRRLVLKPDNAPAGVAWRDRQVYDGRWRDEPISLLYDEGRKSFVTACNLARLLRAEESKDSLRGVKLSLTAEDDSNKKYELKVASVRDDVGSLGVYDPIIPLEVSPLRFRVLVPLEAASACVDLAIKAWEREFACVWDRLPLRVGIVAFSQKLPFQAVIETARNIEEKLELSKAAVWRVTQRDFRSGVLSLAFKRADGGQELRTMRMRLPDGRDDVFYPYLAVEDKSVRFPHDFQHPCGQLYRRASDLRPGDGVRVSPAHFIAVFMDSTAKRFESFKPCPLSEWRRMRETWQLLERVAPSTSSVRGAWSILAEKRATWCGPDGDGIADAKQTLVDLARVVLKDALRDAGAALDTHAVLKDALGDTCAALDALVEAVADGVFERAIEWHLSVLKMKLREDSDGQ